jgi:hypothetical protein
MLRGTATNPYSTEPATLQHRRMSSPLREPARVSATRPPSHDVQETGVTRTPTHPRNSKLSILVDREADVLPMVCALVGRFDKVLCYMHCAMQSMPMYQKLVRDNQKSSHNLEVTSLLPDQRRKQYFCIFHDQRIAQLASPCF